MSITIEPALEARLREKAEAEGVTIEAYVESLLRSEEQAEDELGSFALEGLNFGAPITIDAGYWEEKHRRLEARLKKS